MLLGMKAKEDCSEHPRKIIGKNINAVNLEYFPQKCGNSRL
jgi:hypothetical protein